MRIMMKKKGLGAPVVEPVVNGDPYLDNVTLLMHMDGDDNGTSFIDEKGAIFVSSGGAVTKTAQSKFGSASAYFNGSSTQVYTAQNDRYAFGTDDFTVELFVYPNTTAPVWTGLVSTGGSNIQNPYFTLNYAQPAIHHSGSLQHTGPAVATSQWNHVAYVRQAGVITIYTNGVAGSSVADATNFTADTILAIGSSSVSTQFLNGYIDEVRITKGVARYTENFAPPTSAFVEPISSPTVDPSPLNITLTGLYTNSTSIATNGLPLTISGGNAWQTYANLPPYLEGLQTTTSINDTTGVQWTLPDCRVWLIRHPSWIAVPLTGYTLFESGKNYLTGYSSQFEVYYRDFAAGTHVFNNLSAMYLFDHIPS